MAPASVFRLGTALLAAVAALAAAGCVSTNEPTSLALVSEPKALAAAVAPEIEPNPSAYVSMLRSHGIDASIPSHGKFVLVNIPSFELIAFQDGAPVLRSRVVVGQPKTSTPEMLSSMHAVRFNPSWTPTPAMIRNEGARYMPPGPHNPLGRILFDLDNDELIYLHDTNERGLFGRTQRALSHGCIRVEQARALAAWALGVPEKEIDAMIARGTTYSVPLPEVIPVSLAYHTQFPDASGQLVAHSDIYGTGRAKPSTAEPAGLPQTASLAVR